MSNPNLQLLVYADQVGTTVPETDYKGITIANVHKVENSNYLLSTWYLTRILSRGSLILGLKRTVR